MPDIRLTGHNLIQSRQNVNVCIDSKSVMPESKMVDCSFTFYMDINTLMIDGVL